MATNSNAKFSDTNNSVFIQTSKTVTTTESLVAVGVSNEAKRQSITIENKGDEPVYLGPTGVNSTKGLTLWPCQIAEFDLRKGLSLYAITASGTSTISITEVG